MDIQLIAWTLVLIFAIGCLIYGLVTILKK